MTLSTVPILFENQHTKDDMRVENTDKISKVKTSVRSNIENIWY